MPRPMRCGGRANWARLQSSGSRRGSADARDAAVGMPVPCKSALARTWNWWPADRARATEVQRPGPQRRAAACARCPRDGIRQGVNPVPAPDTVFNLRCAEAEIALRIGLDVSADQAAALITTAHWRWWTPPPAWPWNGWMCAGATASRPGPGLAGRRPMPWRTGAGRVAECFRRCRPRLARQRCTVTVMTAATALYRNAQPGRSGLAVGDWLRMWRANTACCQHRW